MTDQFWSILFYRWTNCLINHPMVAGCNLQCATINNNDDIEEKIAEKSNWIGLILIGIFNPIGSFLLPDPDFRVCGSAHRTISLSFRQKARKVFIFIFSSNFKFKRKRKYSFSNSNFSDKKCGNFQFKFKCELLIFKFKFLRQKSAESFSSFSSRITSHACVARAIIKSSTSTHDTVEYTGYIYT